MGNVSIPSIRYGLIPATITPMDENYQVDYDQLEEYIDWISKFKLGGVAVNVDTSEGPHLNAEERASIIKTYARKVGRRFPIVAGLHARSTDEAVKLGKEAKDSGADGLLVFPHPAFMGEEAEEVVYAYHKEVAEKVGLPIVLFQLQPVLGGIEFGKEVLNRLVEIENVVAIKEASFDAKKFTETVRILEKAPRKITILTGNDNFIYESLVMGAEGGLLGFGTIAVEMQVEMFRLASEGRFKESGEIWKELLPLEETIFSPPVRDYRARLKVALKIMGIIDEAFVRPPLLQITKNEEERIRTTLKSLRMI
jgi:4-hydroxy-tetrahydrodipicolinate synthase